MDASGRGRRICKVALPAARSDLLFLFSGWVAGGKNGLLIGLSDHVYCGTGACVFPLRSISDWNSIGVMMKVMEIG